MDLDRVSIEVGVRLGARERDRIDIRRHDESGAARSRNPRKHSATRTYIQNGFRLPLPAQEIDSRSAQARGGV